LENEQAADQNDDRDPELNVAENLGEARTHRQL
jgi:hypothetical protein